MKILGPLFISLCCLTASATNMPRSQTFHYTSLTALPTSNKRFTAHTYHYNPIANTSPALSNTHNPLIARNTIKAPRGLYTEDMTPENLQYHVQIYLQSIRPSEGCVELDIETAKFFLKLKDKLVFNSIEQANTSALSGASNDLANSSTNTTTYNNDVNAIFVCQSNQDLVATGIKNLIQERDVAQSNLNNAYGYQSSLLSYGGTDEQKAQADHDIQNYSLSIESFNNKITKGTTEIMCPQIANCAIMSTQEYNRNDQYRQQLYSDELQRLNDNYKKLVGSHIDNAVLKQCIANLERQTGMAYNNNNAGLLRALKAARRVLIQEEIELETSGELTSEYQDHEAEEAPEEVQFMNSFDGQPENGYNDHEILDETPQETTEEHHDGFYQDPGVNSESPEYTRVETSNLPSSYSDLSKTIYDVDEMTSSYKKLFEDLPQVADDVPSNVPEFEDKLLGIFNNLKFFVRYFDLHREKFNDELSSLENHLDNIGLSNSEIIEYYDLKDKYELALKKKKSDDKIFDEKAEELKSETETLAEQVRLLGKRVFAIREYENDINDSLNIVREVINGNDVSMEDRATAAYNISHKFIEIKAELLEVLKEIRIGLNNLQEDRMKLEIVIGHLIAINSGTYDPTKTTLDDEHDFTGVTKAFVTLLVFATVIVM